MIFKRNGGAKVQVTGHRSQVTGHMSQVTGYRLQVTGHRSQVTGHRQVTIKNSCETSVTSIWFVLTY